MREGTGRFPPPSHLGQNLSETGRGGGWNLSHRPVRPALRAYCVPGGGLDPTHTGSLQRLRHPGALRPPPPLPAAPVSTAAA